MNNITAACVFGTRPEAIKMAPVVLELLSRPQIFTTRLLVSAQHREMLDQVLDLFRITPDHDLDIMTHGQDLFDITVRTLQGIKQVFTAEPPDIVIVQGDTTTTFAAALAGFYVKAKVAHVEAGLRTHDRYQPYPEEMNRRMTTSLADFNFAPTQTAHDNLIRENVPHKSVYMTGNTVIDALLTVAGRAYDFSVSPLAGVDWSRRVVLVTAHRRENWGEPMRRICAAVRTILERVDDIEVVFSMHMNPLVRTTVEKVLGGQPHVHLVEPLDYEPFVQLMKRSYLILSDSGGVQEEAPSLGKPVLVLREVTERPEGLEAGTTMLVGRDEDRISAAAVQLLSDTRAYEKMATAHNPYGDGQAAKRIVDIIEAEMVKGDK